MDEGTIPMLSDVEQINNPKYDRPAFDMQCFVWHKDQKAVCHCLTAILNLADDSNQDASS